MNELFAIVYVLRYTNSNKTNYGDFIIWQLKPKEPTMSITLIF